MTAMIEVGELTRNVPASAALAIEDELDWEHLAHVHASTFSSVSLVHADRDGWEADVVLRAADAMRMKVTIDPDRMGYVNATFTGARENGRTLARLTATGPEACRMHLRFFVPDAPGVDQAAAGVLYREVWSRILEEDEPKLIHRARALREGPAARRLRRTARLSDGAEVSVPVVCPHQGLPLQCDPDREGVMTCPWHGYRFDARTGACLSGQIKGWGDETPARNERS